MSTLKSWEETKKELKKRGIEKEKIKMAFRLMERIKSLDRIIFPENAIGDDGIAFVEQRPTIRVRDISMVISDKRAIDHGEIATKYVDRS